MTKTKWMYLLFAVFLLPGCGSREENRTDVKKTGLFVINVLDCDWYDDCHIKGSINVPFAELDTFVQTIDPETSEIILYCSNYFCASSMYACKHLKSLGFKQVWAYEGGMAEWHQLGLPVEGACKRAYLTKELQPDDRQAKDESVMTAHILAHKLQYCNCTKAAL